MDMLKDLLKKKGKGPEMEPQAKDAKMSVLKDIRDMAANDMGDEVRGLKKVSVAAPDNKGLEEGLNKAKEMIDSPMLGQEMEHMGEKSDESDKLDEMLGDNCSPEDIDKLIAELQAKKDSLSQSE